MNPRQVEVQKSLANHAKSYGNKSANLIELSDICKIILAKEPRLNVRVPSIYPLSHELIYSHLSDHAPEWKTLWDDFNKAQKKEDKDISDSARDVIRKLQELILNTFQNHPIPTTVLNEYLKQLNCDVDLLMVRSTGKEDSKDLANPGGNESVAAIKAEPKSISEAIGIVIASYFSEKSLKQRLLGKDDITQPPFLPVLLQKMEGEVLGGTNKPSEIVRSGVMYTGKRGTRIQVAPGHGELIVNSKAPFDNEYVTREGVVHSEIRQKTKRLIPTEIKTATGSKRTLEMVNNSKELANTPSLPTRVVARLAKIGEYIEDHYGEPMDVEFVYDPAADIINIVQARPIPQGDLHLIPPSAINPEKLATLKDTAIIQKGSVITAGGSAAKVITAQDEIIVCQTIEEALNTYLSQKNSKVKAVIVKNDAPETSHEAAQFNFKAIPVLRMDDIDNIQKWIKQNNVAIIVDPQRKQVVEVSKYADEKQAEKAKTLEKSLIQEGIFKSTMSAQETLLPLFLNRKFKPSTFYKKPNKIPLGQLLDDLYAASSSQANAAFNNLMRSLYEVIKVAPKEIAQFKEMPTLLEEIENAVPGKDNAKAIESLQKILNRFVSLAKSLEKSSKIKADKEVKQERGTLIRDLFKQAMVTGAEIYHILQEMSQADLKTDANAIRVELLNLVVKLEALISAPLQPGYFSSSLYQWAVERRLRKIAEKVDGFYSLSEDQREYYIAMLQLKNLSLNQPVSEAWVQFALAVCQDNKKSQQIAELILFIQKYNVSSDWINERFKLKNKDNTAVGTEQFLKLIKDNETAQVNEIIESTFASIVKEATETKNELLTLNLDNKAVILTAWEERLTQFSDEEKFPKLWKDFTAEVIPLIDQLDIKADLQPLTQKSIINIVLKLTEVMDHSIKSMKGSPTYKNQKQQVENFYTMLQPFLILMEKWVNKIPDSWFIQWANKIEDNPAMNHKDNMLKLITETFHRLNSNVDAAQLLPSKYFAVAPACVGSVASFERHFNDIRHRITLEDLFTLMHQNILSSINLMRGQLKSSTPNIPEPLRPLISAVEAVDSNKNRPVLLKTDHHYPIFRMEYNLPLRNHSAEIILIYDQIQGTCKVQNKLFGHNHQDRMDIIADMANMFPILQNVKIVHPASYNSVKRIVDFTWELKPPQFTSLAQNITQELSALSDTTFYNVGIGVAQIVPFLKRNVFTRSDLTSQQIISLYASERFSSELDNAIKPITIGSFKSSSKADLITLFHSDIVYLNKVNIKEGSSTKEELKEIASLALQSGGLAILNQLPEEYLPKEALDQNSLKEFLQKLSNSAVMKSLSYPILKVLSKFVIKSEDIIFILQTLRNHSKFESLYAQNTPEARSLVNQFLKPLIAKQVHAKDMIEFALSSLENESNFYGLRLIPDNFKIDLEVSPELFEKYLSKINDYKDNNEVKYAAVSTLFKFNLTDAQKETLFNKFSVIAGDPLFSWAIYMDDFEITKLMIERGQNVNDYKNDPLQTAIGRRNPKILELLIDHSADLNIVNSNKQSTLEQATRRENTDVVKLLLTRGKFTLEEISKCITIAKTLTADSAKNIESLLVEAEAKVKSQNEIVNTSLEMKKP